jgi:imidazole glycerol-phosphate synthase subunit HisH
MTRIAVIDYGMGNRRSVEKALEHVGVEAEITRDHDALRAADGLVLPGVGAFPRAMRNLAELGLDEVIRERADAGVPLLGVCLGMQLLFDESVELGGALGLGLLPGRVTALETAGRRLPHIGWNLARFERASVLNGDLPDEAAFYHVHSFACRPAEAADVLATAEYGERFVTAVARPPLFGVQFHPEKSSFHGLALLSAFARLCARVSRTTLRPPNPASPDGERAAAQRA